MYIPTHFEEKRLDVLRDLIMRNPLAAMVMRDREGLIGNHLPFEHDLEPQPNGTLRGHVARENPIWRDANTETDALVIFQGPAAYVSPGNYPSKQETGKVVPTWNYAVVHAYGPVRFIHDTNWLNALVNRLTDYHEARQAVPWKVSDAPESYIQAKLKAIVGVEIPISKIVGKWKVSQNRRENDRLGVIDGLGKSGNPEEAAISEMLAERVKR